MVNLYLKNRRKGKSVLNSYEYTTAIEIDGMNAEEIRHNIASGGELVILQEEGKQYEFKSVEKYMLYMRPVPKDYEDRWKKWGDDKKQEYRQLRQMFELNFIKKDEQKEVREDTFGRTITPCRLKLMKPVKLR